MSATFHRLGRKINKALGGTRGRRLSQESHGLEHEDHASNGEQVLEDDAISIQGHKPSNEKSIVKNFFKAITEPPRAQPVRTSVPEDEADDENDEGSQETSKKTEPPSKQLDENTPVDVLLARIEYLETSLRSETVRAEALEDQVTQLEAKLQNLERMSHRSFLSVILRPFRVCFGTHETRRDGPNQTPKYNTYGY